MAASLFRMEAVEFQRTRAWAGATTPSPVATWLLTVFFAASISGTILFLALSSYARKETVPGYLTPVTGIAKVSPSAPGVVAEFIVADGDTVQAGQRLLLVRSERHGAQGQAVDASIIDRLQAKRNAIAERIEIEQRAADAESHRCNRACRAGGGSRHHGRVDADPAGTSEGRARSGRIGPAHRRRRALPP